MSAVLSAACAFTLTGCFLVTNSDGSATSTATPAKTITIAAAPTVSATSAIMAAPSASSPKASPLEISVSLAIYDRDRLDQCIDMKEIFNDEIDALNGRADLRSKIPPGATVLEKPCSEAFADRKPFARCIEDMAVTENGKKRGIVSASGDARFYLFETALADDRQMRICLNEHGRWDAIAHDSQEFKAAERESRLRAAEDMLRQH